MLKSIEATGKTEESAIASALEQYGLDRDDVSVEVLNRAKVGFLGFRSTPAKVRISYQVPDPVQDKAEEAEEAVVSQPIQPVVSQPIQPVVSQPIQPVVSEPTQPAESQPIQPAESQPVQPVVSQPSQALPAKGQGKEERPRRSFPKEPLTPEEISLVSQGIVDYLQGLLQHMDVNASPEVRFQEGHFLVNLQGENLGMLIGRRGETLDAIQQITSYSVNKLCPKKLRIYLDAENYREKRAETLEKLAWKVAGEVEKHRRNVPLEAMNAYERHIIHNALESNPAVSTYSTGNDPNRRVVVAWKKKNRNHPN